MVRTIILTSANYDGNSTFKYKALSPIRAPDEVAAIAISSIEFYNMSFNMTSKYGNNTLTLS